MLAVPNVSESNESGPLSMEQYYMKQIGTITILSLISFSIHAQIDQCANIIRMSRLSSLIVQSEASFENHKEHFCREYNRSKQASRAGHFGASYKILSISMGTSSASYEAIASRYCKADGSTISSDSDYKEYIERIDPGAWDAYQACK